MLREINIPWSTHAQPRVSRLFTVPPVTPSALADNANETAAATNAPYGVPSGVFHQEQRPMGGMLASANGRHYLAWQVRPADYTGQRHRMELRLLADTGGLRGSQHALHQSWNAITSPVTTAATATTTASSSSSLFLPHLPTQDWQCVLLEFPCDILPSPSVHASDHDHLFQMNVALANGLIYSVSFGVESFRQLTFDVLAWRLQKAVAETAQGKRIPVLVTFPLHSRAVLGLSNGSLLVADLYGTSQQSTHHYGQSTKDSVACGFVSETMLVPDHNLLSKIKGFIPWTAVSTQVTSGMPPALVASASHLGQRPASTDALTKLGIDATLSQTLAVKTAIFGEDMFLLTWSRDCTLRVWKPTQSKCIRALSLAEHMDRDGMLGGVLPESIESYLRIVAVEDHLVYFIVRLGQRMPVKFALCVLDTTTSNVSLRRVKLFRSEQDVSECMEVLVDFMVKGDGSFGDSQQFEVWSLWHSEGKMGSWVRKGVWSDSDVSVSWTNVLKSPIPYTRCIAADASFESVAEVVRRCQDQSLLLRALEIYIGNGAYTALDLSLNDVREKTLELIQHQATSSKFVSSEHERSQVVNALRIEASRFASCLGKLLDVSQNPYCLCRLDDEMMTLFPSGYSSIKEVDRIEALCYHVQGDMDTSLGKSPPSTWSEFANHKNSGVEQLMDSLADLYGELSTETIDAWSDYFRSSLSFEDAQPSLYWSVGQEFFDNHLDKVELSEILETLRHCPLPSFITLADVLSAHSATKPEMVPAVTDWPSALFSSLVFASIGSSAYLRHRLSVLLLAAMVYRLLGITEKSELRQIVQAAYELRKACTHYEALSAFWQNGEHESACRRAFDAASLKMGYTKIPKVAVDGSTAIALREVAFTYTNWLVSGLPQHFGVLASLLLLECRHLAGAFDVLRCYEEAGWVLFAWGVYQHQAGDLALSSESFQRLAPELVKFGHYFDRNQALFHLLLDADQAVQLHEYYSQQMKRFKSWDASDEAVRFGKLALTAMEMVEGEDDDAAKQRIIASLFLMELDLKNYDASLAYLADITDNESRNSCLKSLIVKMCENGHAHQMCCMPFRHMERDVISSLVFKARNSSIVSEPNYYHILYAFFSIRGDHKNAAKWMCQYGILLRRGRHLDPVESLMGQAKSFVTAINSMVMLPADDAWIAIDKHVLLTTTADDATVEPFLSLPDLRKRYALGITHLKLIARIESLENSSKDLTVKEAVALCNSVGLYEDAIALCELHGMTMETTLKAVATECIQSQLRQPASLMTQDLWEKLMQLLKAHHKPSSDYALVVLESILAYEPAFNIPPWLTKYFRNHTSSSYIRALLKRRLYADAVRFAVSLLDDATHDATVDKPHSLPYSALDQLVLALKTGKSDSLLLQRLQDIMDRYFSRLPRRR